MPFVEITELYSELAVRGSADDVVLRVIPKFPCCTHKILLSSSSGGVRTLPVYFDGGPTYLFSYRMGTPYNIYLHSYIKVLITMFTNDNGNTWVVDCVPMVSVNYEDGVVPPI